MESLAISILEPRNRRSLLFPDPKKVSRHLIYSKCRSSFDELSKKYEELSTFDKLFDENWSLKNVLELSESKLKKLKKNITKYLILLSPHLHEQRAVDTVEWLLSHYHTHIFQPFDLLMAFIIEIESPVFSKTIKLFNYQLEDFKWLKNLKVSSEGSSYQSLANICSNNLFVLNKMLIWILQTVNFIDNKPDVPNAWCFFVYNLMNEFISSSTLSRKPESYQPFTNFITLAASSKNEYLKTISSILLCEMSSVNFKLSDSFINDVLYELMNDFYIIIDKFKFLRRIKKIMILHDQYEPSDDIMLHFRQKLLHLSNSEIEDIDQIIIPTIKEESHIKQDSENTVAKLEKKTVSTMAKELTETINFNPDQLSETMIPIFQNYVLVKDPSQSKKLSSTILKKVNELIEIKISIDTETLKLLLYIISGIYHNDKKVSKLFCKLIQKLHFTKWSNYDKFVTLSKTPELLMKRSTFKIIYELFNAHELDNYLTQFIIELSGSHGKMKLLCQYPKLLDMLIDMITKMNCENSKTLHCTQYITNLWDIFTNLSKLHRKILIDKVVLNDNSDEFMLRGLKLSTDDVLYIFDGLYSKKEAKEINNKLNSSLGLDCDLILEESQKHDKFYEWNDELLIKKLIIFFELMKNCLFENPDNNVQIVIKLFSTLENLIGYLELQQTDISENYLFCLNKLIESITASLSIFESQTLSDSLDVSIIDVSKCLFAIQNPMLCSSIVKLIQKMIALNIGVSTLNIITIMGWLGSKLAPMDDEYSIKVLDIFIRDTLHLYIEKNKPLTTSEEQNSRDIQLLVKMTSDCRNIAPDRALILYKLLITSLSSSEVDVNEKSSYLWIQILIMTVFKNRGNATQASLIKSLIKQFSLADQLVSMRMVVVFMTKLLTGLIMKRKREVESEGDYINAKRRKLTDKSMENNEVCVKTVDYVNPVKVVDENFLIVKRTMKELDLNLDTKTIFSDLLTKFQLIIQDNFDDIVNSGYSDEHTIDFIREMLESCKLIKRYHNIDNNSKLQIIGGIKQLINAMNKSLPFDRQLSHLYVIANSHEDVRYICMEILYSTLESLRNNFNFHSQEFNSIFSKIFVLAKNTLIESTDENNKYEGAISCCMALMKLGYYDNSAMEVANNFIDTYLKASTSRIVSVNSYLTDFVSYKFNRSISDRIIDRLEQWFQLKLQSDCNISILELKSAFLLVTSILNQFSDVDEQIWDQYRRIMQISFDLYEKKGREWLQKHHQYSKSLITKVMFKIIWTPDTEALIDCSSQIFQKGREHNYLFYVNGSIDMINFHIDHLVKSGKIKKKTVKKVEDKFWNLVMSYLGLFESDLRRKTPIKSDCVVGLLFSYFKIENNIVNRIFSWITETLSDNKENSLLIIHRNKLFYDFIECLLTNVADIHSFLKVLDEIDYLTYTTQLLDAIFNQYATSSESKLVKKRKIKTPENLLYTFNFETSHDNEDSQLVNERMLDLIKVCANVIEKFVGSEENCGLTMEVNETNINLMKLLGGIFLRLNNFMVDKSNQDYSDVCHRYMIPMMKQLVSGLHTNQSLVMPLMYSMHLDVSQEPVRVLNAILQFLSDIKVTKKEAFDNIKPHISQVILECKQHDVVEIATAATELDF